MNVRYHLWLKPSRQASDRFTGVIRQLALDLNAPTFEPHITLLGNVTGSETEHVARAQELTRRVPPFPVSMSGAAWGDDYFHCLFLVVDLTAPVRHAHALARRIFHQEEDNRYLPHISLAYGRYSESRKKDLIAGLPASLYLPFEASRLSLIRARSEAPQDWQEVWALRMGDESENGED